MTSLTKSLPKVRGRLQSMVPLAKYTWFKVGGPAEAVYKPMDVADLVFFLQNKPDHVPLVPLGVGSNLLVRDGGIPGVTLRLSAFNQVAVRHNTIDVGAGVLDRTLALIAAQENAAGLEFLCSIPGTIGGALRMNAGCYGSEIKDVLEAAFAVDAAGTLHTLTPDDMGFTYRHCAIPEDWIFVGARFRTKSGQQAAIQSRMDDMLQAREETQPVTSATGGSTFANPTGHKAWELIDRAGFRGKTVGGAQFSEKHCNFLINTGHATAADLEALAEQARAQVLAQSGVELRWEIQRIGQKEALFLSCAEAA